MKRVSCSPAIGVVRDQSSLHSCKRGCLPRGKPEKEKLWTNSDTMYVGAKQGGGPTKVHNILRDTIHPTCANAGAAAETEKKGMLFGRPESIVDACSRILSQTVLHTNTR